ncbi:Menaquinone via futalosine step 4 [hydrothermal vent metagenome]|uniref:Menaquinone via futalosine step 4 n=1 Tax=hydrothermal vent metagenome TaxID=652676 RepID=A0A3B1E0L7_9ZZZZ
MSRTIRIAYTPDSDDAFYYYAMQSDIVGLPGVQFQFEVDHIINLNQCARDGTHDVVAISSVAYPDVSALYRVLSVGTSVGRGYGPVLVSQKYQTLEELSDKRIAVGGIPTTGGYLAEIYLPNAEIVSHQFDLIADGIVEGIFDAGVMIHEELLFFPQKGLHQIADLGKKWCEENHLPLPVGLNIISRHIEDSLMQDIADCIRESLGYALTHRKEALDWASEFGRGKEGQVSDAFVSMFANTDSLLMPTDVREGLEILLAQVHQSSGAIEETVLDIVDGRESVQNKVMDLIQQRHPAA